MSGAGKALVPYGTANQDGTHGTDPQPHDQRRA